MANLVEQIFLQAQAGSANGEGFGDAYIQGRQLRQDQQRINLMERQLAQQAAMQEVERVTMMQQQRINSVKLQEVMEMRQLEADTKEKQMNLLNAYRERMSAQDPEGAQLAVLDFASSTPFASRLPIVKTLLDDSRNGLQAKIELAKIKGTDPVDPEIRQIKDPSTGKVRSVLRTGPNSWKEVDEPESYSPEIVPVTDPTTGKQVPVLRTGPKSGQVVRDQTESTSGFGKLVSEYNAAVKSGDKTTAQFYDAKIKKEITPTGMQIKTNPDGTIELTQGAIDPEALTRTNQTKTQESFNSELQVIDLADRLEPILDNETVGVQAWAESILKDRLLSQWLPGVSSTKRADAEVLASDLRSARIKALKTDGQIGVKEIAQIEKAVPEINAPLKSAEGQRNLVKGIRKVSAMRAAFKAKLLGVPIPPLVVFRLDDKDLAEMANNGLITRQMAIDAKKSR